MKRKKSSVRDHAAGDSYKYGCVKFEKPPACMPEPLCPFTFSGARNVNRECKKYSCVLYVNFVCFTGCGVRLLVRLQYERTLGIKPYRTAV